MKNNYGSLTIDFCKNLDMYIQIMLQDKKIWQSLDINYHAPRVERLWAPLYLNNKKIRVHLHVIHPTTEKCLFHKHKWPAVIHQIRGTYKMGLTDSQEEIDSTNAHNLPVLASFIVGQGSWYEMRQTDTLHFVKPTKLPSYSIMFTVEDELFPEANLRRENTGEYHLEALTEEREDEIRNLFIGFLDTTKLYEKAT